jgi:hypothetical protein
MPKLFWEPHKVIKPHHWPFNSQFWWWLLRGVKSSDWRRVCWRCRYTGQAHLHRESGACQRFKHPPVFKGVL